MTVAVPAVVSAVVVVVVGAALSAVVAFFEWGGGGSSIDHRVRIWHPCLRIIQHAISHYSRVKDLILAYGPGSCPLEEAPEQKLVDNGAEIMRKLVQKSYANMI